MTVCWNETRGLAEGGGGAYHGGGGGPATRRRGTIYGPSGLEGFRDSVRSGFWISAAASHGEASIPKLLVCANPLASPLKPKTHKT